MTNTKKKDNGPITVKYPCNKSLKLEGFYSATCMDDCDHNCYYCGFNPEENNRRHEEGNFVVNPATCLSTLVFPKRKQSCDNI